MDSGQGGSITLSNKTKPRPIWFNKDANWSKYTPLGVSLQSYLFPVAITFPGETHLGPLLSKDQTEKKKKYGGQ